MGLTRQDHNRAYRLRRRSVITANEAAWLEEFDKQKGNAGRPLLISPKIVATATDLPFRNSAHIESTLTDLKGESPPIPLPKNTNGVPTNADIGSTLQNIATQTVKVDSIGGTCPYCFKAVSDSAKWCDHCGNFTKTGECVKCNASMQGPFCKACGAEAYKPKPVSIDSSAIHPVSIGQDGKPLETPPLPSYNWDATSLAWFGETMNLICTIGGCEGDDEGNVIDDKVKEKMVLASVPVANKHLQAQGKYKEEINLAMVCIPPVFMAFYFQYITKPKLARLEAKRKEEQEEKKRIERDTKQRQRELDKKTGLVES